MRNLEKTLIAIIVLIITVSLYLAYWANTEIARLEEQTIDWQLKIVRDEARKLEAIKKEYEAQNIDWRLQELYNKSWKLQNINTTGDNWKLSK